MLQCKVGAKAERSPSELTVMRDGSRNSMSRATTTSTGRPNTLTSGSKGGQIKVARGAKLTSPFLHPVGKSSRTCLRQDRLFK